MTPLHARLPVVLLSAGRPCAARLRVAPAPLALAALLAFAGATPLAARAASAGQAYVSNQSGNVSVIDLATMEVSGEISAFGKEPRGIGLTADGKYLVTANRDDGEIAVIDRASGALIRKIRIGANPEFVRTRGHMAFVSFEPSSTGKAPPSVCTASQGRARPSPSADAISCAALAQRWASKASKAAAMKKSGLLAMTTACLGELDVS